MKTRFGTKRVDGNTVYYRPNTSALSGVQGRSYGSIEIITAVVTGPPRGHQEASSSRHAK